MKDAVSVFAKSIVDTVRHPLVVLDADEQVVAANHAYFQNFNLDPAESIGRRLFETGNGIWNIPQLRTLLREVVANDGAFEGYEIEHDIPNLGRRVMFLSARRVTRDDDGSPMTLLAIEDVTKRRQDQAALEQLHRDLEEMIAQRTGELLAANGELRASVLELAAVNRELEAFCYSVSHDLRTPLRSIDGFSLELSQSHSDQLDEKGHHYLRRIRIAVQRMGQLIDDLLKLSRTARAEMNRSYCDLTALAESVAADLRQQDPQRVVTFRIQPGLSANCDPRLARIVLENLLGNAWKFTCKKPSALIELLAGELDGQPAFVVRDDGAGFDPAFKGKLFGAFQRLHTDREFPGTGIGLATVQRIIQRHGGMMEAEGTVGRGAAFYFTFPERIQGS